MEGILDLYHLFVLFSCTQRLPIAIRVVLRLNATHSPSGAELGSR